MNKPNFKPLINRLLSELETPFIKPVGTGDVVTIPKDIEDPMRRQGQTGEVVFIEDKHHRAIVKFGTNEYGAYNLDIFEDPSTRNIIPLDTALSSDIYEASEEEIENQRELNRELEKTAEYKKEIVGESSRRYIKEEDVWDLEDKEPSNAAVNRKDSVSTTARKLQDTVKAMKTTVEKYKKAEGDEKDRLLNRLKKLTKIKKELENLL